MLEIGETVDRYRVEGLLGGGGLAAVFKVRHTQLGTLHALKVLVLTTQVDRARLLAEGQVQARLRHPNVVAVTDLLTISRTPALVMELVEGPTLEQRLEQGPLRPTAALSLFRGIVSGVGAAHAAGLVHRDLKPSNVLLSQSASSPIVAKVTDFGLVRFLDGEARHTVTGTAVGTPAYMAPEQIRDPRSVDGRADLWALGCLLYEMLTGRRAFLQDDPFALYTAIANGAYEDPAALAPDAPLRALAAVHGLLRTDPDDRTASCVALWEQLWEDPVPPDLIDGVPLDLPPASISLTPTLRHLTSEGVVPRPPPPDRRRRALPLLALLLLGAVGCAILAWRGSQPRPLAPPPPQPVQLPVEPEPEIPDLPAPIPVAEPRPIPAPAPLAESLVGVEGDATEVWLEADGKRVELGRVPPGTYTLRVVWTPGAEPRSGGQLLVSPGAQVLLRCARFVFACKVMSRDNP